MMWLATCAALSIMIYFPSCRGREEAWRLFKKKTLKGRSALLLLSANENEKALYEYPLPLLYR